jgi:hypothetical protein
MALAVVEEEAILAVENEAEKKTKKPLVLPNPPVRRLYVDAFFCVGFSPSAEYSTTGKHDGVYTFAV